MKPRRFLALDRLATLQSSQPVPLAPEPVRQPSPFAEIVVGPCAVVNLAQRHLSPAVIDACWRRDVPVEQKRVSHVG